MANLITSLRLILLFGIVALAYQPAPMLQLSAAPLLLVVFALDGVDGFIARWRNEVSLFGSVYDIAADRIVENVLWIVLVDLQFVPVWVAIVFITRGFLVDYIRSYGVRQGYAPFDIMRSRLGRFLVKGRPVRFLYAAVKMLVFTWILFIHPWPELFPQLWVQLSPSLERVTDILVYLAVALCLARGLPVVVEFLTNGTALFRPHASEKT